MNPRFRLIPALLLALAAAGLVYGSLLFRAGPLERDDQALLAPLEAVAGPAGYARAWREGRVLDIAPVRDLTFAADLALGRTLGVPTFTFTNVLLWLCFVALALMLFRSLEFGDGALWTLLAVLVAHPVYAESVAWISARKHLLAGVFCLGATLLVVSPPKRFARTAPPMLYVLSLLSHPIHLLWPVWAFAFRLCGRRLGAREAALPLVPCGVAMVLFGGLNSWYYATLYLKATGGISKFGAEEGPAVAALALGRAIFNLLVPIRLSPVDYFPGSWPNLAGLALAPILFWTLAKTVPWRTLVPWTLFLFLPLLLLNARATRVFLSDTYLLVPSLALWILLAEAAKGRARAAPVLVGALLIPGLLTARVLAASFGSMESLFALAYAREATPQVAAVHAKQLFEHGFLREAAEISFAAIPNFPEAETTFAQAVARDASLSADQKLALLRKAPGRSPFLRFFVGETLAGSERYDEAFREISPALGDLRQFGKDAPLVAGEALAWAAKGGHLTHELEASVKAQLGGAER